MARSFILLSVILYGAYVTEQADFLQKNFIDNINNVADTWKVIRFRRTLEHLRFRIFHDRFTSILIIIRYINFVTIVSKSAPQISFIAS